jgi:hypothetical protein
MLDLTELTKGAAGAAATVDNDPGFRSAVIISSAIDAAHALARQNPQADLSNVKTALKNLIEADDKSLAAAHVPKRIVSDAQRSLEMLKENR